jgi:CPA1 family monovalent cation:H+ antiporter
MGRAVWDIVIFIINGFAFMLIGLQLPSILKRLTLPTETVLAYALVISLTVIIARFVWVFPATYLPRWLIPRIGRNDPAPPLRAVAVISWAGLRGAVSLAAALALPPDFPERDLLLLLTFAVILATLVGQGLTMPLVIRALGLEDDGVGEREAVKARIHAADAALNRIDELSDEEWVREDTAERLRRLYQFRRNRFAERYTGDGDGAIEERSAAYQQLLRELIEAEREAVVELRGAGAIGDDAMREVHRELDLEEARLDL